VSEGARLDAGFLSAGMATSGTGAVLVYPYILLVDDKIEAGLDLGPVMNLVAPTGNPLLIIADMVEGEAVRTLVQNKPRGALASVAVLAPEYGERRARRVEGQGNPAGIQMRIDQLWREMAERGAIDASGCEPDVVSRSAHWACARASTRRPASTATCSRPACSTRCSSRGRRRSTPPRSPRRS